MVTRCGVILTCYCLHSCTTSLKNIWKLDILLWCRVTMNQITILNIEAHLFSFIQLKNNITRVAAISIARSAIIGAHHGLWYILQSLPCLHLSPTMISYIYVGNSSLFISFLQFRNKVSLTQFLLRTSRPSCYRGAVEHLHLPWLPIEVWGLTPEETNQDTVPYPEVVQFPYQDLGSGETCGSLIHKPTLDFPMLETDAPQTFGKLFISFLQFRNKVSLTQFLLRTSRPSCYRF